MSKRNLKSTHYKNYVSKFDLNIKEEVFIKTDRYIFKIKRTRRNFLICLKDHEEHGHFDTIQGCGLLIDFINTRTIPHDDYFREAIVRVIGEYEFSKFVERNKQKYKNNCRIR